MNEQDGRNEGASADVRAERREGAPGGADTRSTQTSGEHEKARDDRRREDQTGSEEGSNAQGQSSREPQIHGRLTRCDSRPRRPPQLSPSLSGFKSSS